MNKGREQVTGHAGKQRKRNFCFGCGRHNVHGMGLNFTVDETGTQFLCRFRLGKRYTGPPGHCHGGIIATILDEAMSKLNRLFEVPAPTSRMTVEYLRPVPLNRRLEVWSKNVSKRGRRLLIEVLTDVGHACNDRGHRVAALKSHEEALRIAEEIGDRYHTANILNLIGLVYDDWGQRDRALNYP